MGIVESKRTDLIAFYLPQYHPTPENDKWWGQGYTEWIRTVKAKPLFHGHEQPHLPADLGFYDLRLPETRKAQADLAKEYGISAFCYYHYWFNGKRMLERPVNDLIALGEPDFPFCICWANETWTRSWDQKDREVLLDMEYSDSDDEAHFQTLVPIFRDTRYLKRNGCPIFLIYSSSSIPGLSKRITNWQRLAREHGFPGLHLLRVESHCEEPQDPRPWGFEAAVEYQPRRLLQETKWQRRFRKLRHLIVGPHRSAWRHRIEDYNKVARRSLASSNTDYPRHPGIFPNWDNTARRMINGYIVTGASPKRYEAWLKQILEHDTSGMVFINAWNEWSEGCHLEPCQRHGRAHLEATRAALQSSRQSG